MLSAPAPPIRVSAPPPPLIVSPPSPPSSKLFPLSPVMLSSKSKSPESTRDAPVPARVSVPPFQAIAASVVPEILISSAKTTPSASLILSLPSSKPEIVSPSNASNLNTSSPSPPASMSAPAPPSSVSFPIPPSSVSFPIPPSSESIPAPPSRKSAPAPPLSASLPPSPCSLSFPASPSSVSFSSRPLIVSLPSPPDRLLAFESPSMLSSKLKSSEPIRETSVPARISVPCAGPMGAGVSYVQVIAVPNPDVALAIARSASLTPFASLILSMPSSKSEIVSPSKTSNWNTSSPSPPIRLSAPAWPLRVSFPSPPDSVSSSRPPSSLSSPAPPSMLLASMLPVSASPWADPIRFSMPLSESPCAWPPLSTALSPRITVTAALEPS